MRRLGLCLFLLGLWLGNASAGAAPSPLISGITRADALFAGVSPSTPGLSILVTQGDTVLYQRIAGAADLEQATPLTPHTRFHIASISKQFTAVAALLLARDGKLRLDAPVSEYLPELTGPVGGVTIAQLLSHTGGIRDQWDLVTLSGGSMSDLIGQDWILSMLKAQQALNFKPGADFRYSNSGFTLVAEVVRRISGQPLAVFLQDRVFGPLGMADTLVYDDASALVPGRANSYSMRSGAPRLSRLNYNNHGATSMMSTAADLQRWARELLVPRVLDRSIIDLMTQRTRLTDGRLSDYAFGLYRHKAQGTEAVMHGGLDAAYRAVFAVYPREGIAIIILSNGGASTLRMQDKLVEAFVTGQSPPQPIAQPAAPTLNAMAGYYVSDWGSLELRSQGARLTRQRVGAAPSEATFYPAGIFRFSQPTQIFRHLANGTIADETEAGPPVMFHRVERVVPSAALTAALPGHYHSDEVDATLLIENHDGGLVVRSQRKPAMLPLAPAQADTFDFADGQIRIQRGPGGRVTALLVSTEGARNVRFGRVN